MNFASIKNFCWIDELFDLFRPIPFTIASFLIALSVYTISFIPMIFAGQFSIIIAASDRFLLGMFAHAFVLIAYRCGSRNYGQLLDRVRQVINDSAKPEFDKNFLQLLTSAKKIIPVIWKSLILWFILMSFIIASHRNLLDNNLIRSIFFMPSSWYLRSGLIWRTIAIGIQIISISVIAVSAFRLQILHIRHVTKLKKFSFLPIPKTCLHRLKPFIRFGIIYSLLWSIGIAYLAIFFRIRTDVFSLSILGCMGMIGTSAFIIPMTAFWTILRKIRDENIEEITKIILETLKSKRGNLTFIRKLHQLEEYVELSHRIGPIFLGWRYVISFISTFLIPVVATILQNLFKDFAPF